MSTPLPGPGCTRKAVAGTRVTRTRPACSTPCPARPSARPPPVLLQHGEPRNGDGKQGQGTGGGGYGPGIVAQRCGRCPGEEGSGEGGRPAAKPPGGCHPATGQPAST